jgi:hypothetical protein
MGKDDAKHADLVINQAFIDKVKKEDGKWLNFTSLSKDDKEKLCDEHNLISILDSQHFKANAIENIYLSYSVGITDAALLHIATTCTQLETLGVEGCCVKITDDGIEAIVEKILGDNLKRLHYDTNCNRCTDSAFRAVVWHCPNLEYLYANNTGNIVFAAIFSSYPSQIFYSIPTIY